MKHRKNPLNKKWDSLTDPVNSFVKYKKILKGRLDSNPTPSVKIQIMGGKVCLRCKGKSIAGRCQQKKKKKKFIDINVLPY